MEAQMEAQMDVVTNTLEGSTDDTHTHAHSHEHNLAHAHEHEHNDKHISLEDELNHIRAAYQSLQEQNEALQHENNNLKVKLQAQQQNAMNENNTSVATAAAAAQLNNYQQALNLSEGQKQQIMAENEMLKTRLVQLGVTFENHPAETTNDPTQNGMAVGMMTTDDGEDDSDETWEIKFNTLLKFKENQGHFHVSYESDPSLAKWIQTQRMLQRSKSMKEKRAAKLVSINFFEETTDIQLTSNDVNSDAAAAVAAMDHSGQLDISAAEAEALAAVDTTVHHTHHHVLTSPSATGLSSRSDEKWEQHFQRLLEYKTTNGNCLVPTSTELGRWLCRQRHNHRYKGLKEDRKLRLMDLDSTCLGERLSDLNGGNEDMMNDGNVVDTNGMIQIPPQLSTKTKYNLAYESKLHAKWDHYFQQLVAYKNEHGHSNFPTMNGSLGRWISRQRTLYRSQKLKSDRFEKLKLIGFAFEDATALEFKGKLDLQWENMCKQLIEHKERTGHCFDVPEDMPLGKWLYRQRWLYRHGNLREDRAKKLLDMGFEDKKILKKDIDSAKKKKRKRTPEIENTQVQDGVVRVHPQQQEVRNDPQDQVVVDQPNAVQTNVQETVQETIQETIQENIPDTVVPVQMETVTTLEIPKEAHHDAISFDQIMEESIEANTTKDETLKTEDTSQSA